MAAALMAVALMAVAREASALGDEPTRCWLFGGSLSRYSVCFRFRGLPGIEACVEPASAKKGREEKRRI